MIAPAHETRMHREAAEAAAVVSRQLQGNREVVARLGQHLRRSPPQLVMTCGRGSSDHAATFAKYLIETSTGIPVGPAAPALASIYGVEPKLDRCLFIAISQSGKSPDLLASAAAARAGGAMLVVLVNDAGSPLAQMADEVIPLQAGPEISVAATKSYIAALAALLGLVSEWTADAALAAALAEAPELLESAWNLDWSPFGEAFQSASSAYVIGRGLGLGVAQEGALKLKETCRLHAEAFSAAEVRHGPLALVKPGFPMLLFRQSDATAQHSDELASDLVARGARVLIAGGSAEGAVALPAVSSHPAVEPMLQIQSFYRAVDVLSRARGLDPDRPPHLAKVTETL